MSNFDLTDKLFLKSEQVYIQKPSIKSIVDTDLEYVLCMYIYILFGVSFLKIVYVVDDKNCTIACKSKINVKGETRFFQILSERSFSDRKVSFSSMRLTPLFFKYFI